MNRLPKVEIDSNGAFARVANRKRCSLFSTPNFLQPRDWSHVTSSLSLLSLPANLLIMIPSYSLKIVIVSLIAFHVGLLSTQAQRHGTEPIVTTGSPGGLIKKVEPEYPMGYVIHGAKGKGRFRLTINAKSGLVDEVKILQSTGYRQLNELAVKALLQWTFRPGTPSPVEVPVEFDIQGGNRILH
jgi:TonB family protein